MRPRGRAGDPHWRPGVLSPHAGAAASPGGHIIYTYHTARLDEELEAGEYVTEFVDLSEEESSEEGDAAGAEGEETGEQESGGGRRKRERGRRGTGNQREVRQRIGGIL